MTFLFSFFIIPSDNLKYSSDNSIPKPLILLLTAERTDVPLPENGSSMISLLSLNFFATKSGMSNGKGAVCPNVFYPFKLILITGENSIIFSSQVLAFLLKSTFFPDFLKINMCSYAFTGF